MRRIMANLGGAPVASSLVVSSLFVSSLFVSVALAQGASPQAYLLEEGGTVRFEARGPTVTHAAEGRFSVVTSRLELDPTDLSRVRGQVEVLLTSITTDESEWDEMFRRAPFLALDEHPRARLEITRVRGARALRPNQVTPLSVFGRFTVHGVTRDVRVAARVKWIPATEDRPEKIEVQATFAFDWTSHEINVPTGHTRTFAGNGAAVTAELTYARPAPPTPRP